ncbi:MAG TPA: hypothetical protein V6C57_17495 [Coleofasciculaceae cyanobacterium]
MIRFNQAIAIGATLGLLTLASCSNSQPSATTEPASPAASASPAAMASPSSSPAAMANASPSAMSASPSAMSSMPKSGEFGEMATVVSNTTAAVNAGDFAKAQTEIDKFESPWSKVEDGVKAKSSDTYNAIEESVDNIKSALKGADKAKALAALKSLGESVNTAAKS